MSSACCILDTCIARAHVLSGATDSGHERRQGRLGSQAARHVLPQGSSCHSPTPPAGELHLTPFLTSFCPPWTQSQLQQLVCKFHAHNNTPSLRAGEVGVQHGSAGEPAGRAIELPAEQQEETGAATLCNVHMQHWRSCSVPARVDEACGLHRRLAGTSNGWRWSRPSSSRRQGGSCCRTRVLSP